MQIVNECDLVFFDIGKKYKDKFRGLSKAIDKT